jgi:hypothetical protein
VFGPFPVPGSLAFDSSYYYGMMANLPATAWNAPGYLSIRAYGSPVPVVSNVNFSGALIAVPNFVITQFGPPTSSVARVVSDGKILIHVEGPSAVHVIVDLFAYLGPDQCRSYDTVMAAPTSPRIGRYLECHCQQLILSGRRLSSLQERPVSTAIARHADCSSKPTKAPFNNCGYAGNYRKKPVPRAEIPNG